MPKIFLGGGWKRSATWMKASIDLEKCKGHITEINGKKYLKININVLDAPDQYGKDVSITLDDYQGKPKEDSGLPF